MRTIPHFTLKDEDGREFDWRRLLGKYTVVYFYPKANTPGCTMEGIDFTNLIDEFDGNVVGISPDRCNVIALFKSKRGLKVKLLSDPDKVAAEGFGALRDGKFYRSTYIVDPWGRIRREWPKVNVVGHAREVLEEYRRIIEEDRTLSEELVLRRAYRGISSAPVPDEDLQRLIEAAHMAPSCSNKQPWRFIVVRSRETLERLHEALSAGNYWMKDAPALIVVYTRDELDCQLSDARNYALFDTGMAVGLLLVQSTKMGLVAHPVAGYDPLKVKEVLGIDGTVITLIAIGRWGAFEKLNEKHLDAEFSERNRLPLSEVCRFV